MTIKITVGKIPQTEFVHNILLMEISLYHD